VVRVLFLPFSWPPILLAAVLIGGCGQARSPTLAVIPASCASRSTRPVCYTPQQIRVAYDIRPLLREHVTGQGRTIVILATEGATEGDVVPFATVRASIRTYDHVFDLRDPPLTRYAPFGGQLTLNAAAEAIEDIEVAHAVAPGAAIRLVTPDGGSRRLLGRSGLRKRDAVRTQSLVKAMRYSVFHHLGDVLSVSYDVSEACLPRAIVRAMHAVLEAARSQHVTVVASAGDYGALAPRCTVSSASVTPGVSLPASDPLVTAVGGTQLLTSLPKGVYRSETAWRGSEEPSAGRAGSYRFLDVASGGGFSRIFRAPAYQRTLDTGGRRGVPDVAFDAAADTGVALLVRSRRATSVVAGEGTSLGAPAWAGVAVLADAYARRRIGLLNPCLYRLGETGDGRRAFHDVSRGSNTVRVGLLGNKSVHVQGFEAKPGWDAVTGWGTPKVDALVPLLAACSRQR